MADAVRVLAIAQAPALGGAELAMLRLARLLPDEGFDVTAATPARGPLADALRAAGAPVVTIPVGGLDRGEWLGALAGWRASRRVLRTLRPSLVWLNGVVPLRLAPALADTTIVPYLHDLLHNTPRPWRSDRFWARTPIVMCASEAVARRAADAGAPAERLRVVWAPVERAQSAPEPSWAGGGPVIGYVGRIEPRKGTLDLLHAFPLLLDRWPNAKLVLVGDGDLGAPAGYLDAVRREADGLGDHVLQLGRVEGAATLMPWFDVLAVPSAEEPFGTVAAEALAAGTPVVATRSGGMEEYVRPGIDGELVEPGDQRALAEALHAVLARSSDHVAQARAEGAARFEPARVAAAVAECFREALAVAR